MGLRAREARSGVTVAATLEGHGMSGRIAHRIAALGWWWCVAVVAAIAAIVIALAYQTHPAYGIAVGARVQDDPLVRDFNAAERQPMAVGGQTFRWTRAESAIAFPGIGRTAARVVLTMAGGANPNPDVVILANNGEITRVRLTPDFADYPLTVPAPYLTTGNLTLTIQTKPFRAPGDRRELGVLVSRVRVQPGGGVALPPARTALALWSAVVLLLLALLVGGLRGWEASAAALLVALGCAALLVRTRLFVAEGAGPWVRVAAVVLLVAAVLRFAVPWAMRWLGIAGGLHTARWLIAAVIGVLAARLGGLYHPAMIVSDLIFHVHRLEDVIDRHIWYQEIPALYDRNRPVPYPPGAYLLFAPFALVVRSRADLLTIGTQLLDVSRMIVVGLVVWKATRDRIAATCAATLTGIVPLAFIIFSWGNLTNAVGEWALTLLFALCVLGGERLRAWWVAAVSVAVITLALLSHIGVAVTTVALLGALFAVWVVALLRAHRAPWRERDFVVALTLACVAGTIAFGLFYRIPLAGVHAATDDPALAASPAVATGGKYAIGGPRPDPSIGLNEYRTGNPVVAVVGQLGVEGYAFYRVWPLLVAPLGFWLLWRGLPNPPAPFPILPRGHPEGEGDRLSRRLCVMSLVWGGVAIVFLVVGVLAERYVRYAVTAIPAVAVGAGVALGYGWRWRWERAVVVMLLMFSAVSTALVWYGRITRAYHT